MNEEKNMVPEKEIEQVTGGLDVDLTIPDHTPRYYVYCPHCRRALDIYKSKTGHHPPAYTCPGCGVKSAAHDCIVETR